MQLITEEIREKLPPLQAQEDTGGDAVAYLKLFTPDSQWSWYATEHDGQDLLFGLVCGLETELGYFRLSELRNVRGPLGLPIERDLYWEPKPLRKVAPELFSSKKRG